jgi:hypothetical protein
MALTNINPVSAGTKNYITNGNFEGNSTTGWSLGHVSALTNGLPTGTPTFGSGSSSNLALSTTGTGALQGSYSLQLASSAATTVGDMLASNSFTIDLEDQSRILTFKFSYSPSVGGGNANWSGTSANSFGVAIYDVTNAAFLPSTANFGMTQISGVGICTGTFQTPSNSTQFRLVVYNANATSGAITILFDDFTVGPQSTSIGAVVTDWTPYIPTVMGDFGSYVSLTASWRRVGGSMEITGDVIPGTATGVATQVSLPDGYTIDTSGTRISSGTYQIVGSSGQDRQATPCFVIATAGGTSVFFGYFSSGDSASIPQAVVVSNHYMSWKASVPIQGWSSSVQMSSDTDTRVISFVGSATSQTLTAGVDIPFTITSDNTASWNGTQFKVPTSGDYMVSGGLSIYASGWTPSVFLNGVQFASAYWTTGSSGQQSNGSTLVTGCKAGDLISLRSNGGGTSSNANLYIYRLSGPATIAASESVNAVYGLNTDQSVSAANPIKYDTKLKDTHSAYSPTSGLYTVPVSGTYTFSGIFQSGAILGVYCVVNGTTISYMINAIAANNVCNASIDLPCKAGDTVSFRIDNGATIFGNAGASGYRNMFSVKRIGN